jgi:hypothetical protein
MSQMFSRILGVPLLLGAAVAVPYLATNGSEELKKIWNSAGANDAEATSNFPEMSSKNWLNPAPRGPGHEIYPVNTPLEGIPSVSLEEVFRFDVTKEWVYERWARKSTALAELGSYGVRMPLVTGTQIYDLAGSLTYFFDSSGNVQRISFKGNTGDTTKVVALVQQLGLQHQTTAVVGEQLFQIKQGSDVFSELRTRPSSVLWSSSPHDSFAVELDLQRPEATTPLPSRLLPLPEVKTPESGAKTDGTVVEDSKTEEKKGFRESLKAFFPRSRVPSPQVKSLEKRDRIW